MSIPTTGRNSSGFFKFAVYLIMIYCLILLCGTHVLSIRSPVITKVDSVLIPCQKLFSAIQPDVFHPVIARKLLIISNAIVFLFLVAPEEKKWAMLP